MKLAMYRFTSSTGKKITSHIAFPRSYDPEVVALISNFHSASITASGPTRLRDLDVPDLRTGVPPTITSLQAADDPPPAPMPGPTHAQHPDMDPHRLDLSLLS